jgi:hypothetical protein
MKVSHSVYALALLCACSITGLAAASNGASAPKSSTPNPWSLKATLSAPGSPLEFGYSVKISPDGNTIAITANTLIDVYVKPKTGWKNMTKPTATLTPSDGAFLSAVAISGDTIVAGAESANNFGGGAYVFSKPSSGWKNMTETAKLTSSDATAGNFFGASVAVSGSTIVVGAIENNSVGASFPPEPNGPGAVYVYTKPSSGWSNMNETAKLTASDGASGDDLGFSVVAQGDTIAASAPNAAIGSTTLEGAIYLFQKSGSLWKTSNESAKLTASDGHFVTVLGMGLSISGNTLVAAGFDKIYLYFKPTGGWASTTQGVEFGSTSYSSFGLNSVAVSGKYVLAGSPYSNVPFADIYVKASGGWDNMTPSYRFKAPTGNGNGADGWAVALSGTTLVVSSPLLGGNGGNLVYVYGQ